MLQPSPCVIFFMCPIPMFLMLYHSTFSLLFTLSVHYTNPCWWHVCQQCHERMHLHILQHCLFHRSLSLHHYKKSQCRRHQPHFWRSLSYQVRSFSPHLDLPCRQQKFLLGDTSNLVSIMKLDHIASLTDGNIIIAISLYRTMRMSLPESHSKRRNPSTCTIPSHQWAQHSLI